MSKNHLRDKTTNTSHPSKGDHLGNSGNKNDFPIRKGHLDSGDLGGRGATVPKTLRPPPKN